MNHTLRRAQWAWLAAIAAMAAAAPAADLKTLSHTVKDDAGRSKQYYVYHIKFETVDARTQFEGTQTDAKTGVTVYSKFGPYADAYVDPGRKQEFLSAVKAAGGWADFDTGATIPPPKVAVAPAELRGATEEIFRGDPQLRGKGVIIAVIDSGVDLRHEDFVRIGPDKKKSSRILYFWDTTRQPPATGPGSTVKSKF